MFVVTVEFLVTAGCAGQFLDRVRDQAEQSRQEPGCRQFDVCHDPDDAHRVLLYEAYVDRDAFASHLATSHFARFSEQTNDLVTAKTVRVWTLATGPGLTMS
jgi:autoinducer 2-degrading protein